MIGSAFQGRVQRGFRGFHAIQYPMKMKLFGLSETKLLHVHGIFKINETQSAKRPPHLHTYGPHFQESLIRPPESGGIPGKFADLNNLNIRSLPYAFPLFRKNKSALSYYGSAQT